MSILVVDVGTSSVRGAVVRPDATVDAVHQVATLPSSPAPGLVEFDADALAAAAVRVAEQALADGGPVAAVGIANQRASTVVWDVRTGKAVGPGIGWQDLRTVIECLTYQGSGLRLAPNMSATKLQWLVANAPDDLRPHLRFGTVDTWIAWHLSGGSVHATDLSNAGITGLLRHDATGWDEQVFEALGLDLALAPALVDSTGVFGAATALPGSPPLAGMAGDQQASLIGQGCVRPGMAKATFGTGGMLDLCLGPTRPSFTTRGPGGTFPIVAWRADGALTWGVEAVMLSAGSCIEWLRDDLGLIESAAASHDVASQCDDTGDVWFVPALLGLGTPVWDHGARGALVGITRGSGRAEITRAVLEGIAHRGADLVEAAETDAADALPGASIASLRIDGGMSANPTFVQALADATQRPVEVSPVLEATTLGAAFLAGLATGTWGSVDELAGTWHPSSVIEPAKATDRERWRAARDRATGWIADFSGLDFS